MKEKEKMNTWNETQARTKKHMPCVCIFGVSEPMELSTPGPRHEAQEIMTLCFETDKDLTDILVQYRPHVFVTISNEPDSSFPNLFRAPSHLRQRWLHVSPDKSREELSMAVWYLYLRRAIADVPDIQPLVSIFMPTYRSGKRFQRAFDSLQRQSYTNWELTIVDDSDDDGVTLAMLQEYAQREPRMRVYKPSGHCGIIGEVKYQACCLSHGTYLVELDHDDELTVDALRYVVDGFAKHPDAGFLTTDWCEVYEDDNTNRTYGDGFAYGLERYEDEVYDGFVRKVVKCDAYISSKGIRSLVAAPNHLRAWRRDLYFRIGGHARQLHIADDMDLMIRTFLNTRMIHVQRLGYIQYFVRGGMGNTQLTRNKDIQRHVRYLCALYDKRIHERFIELGVEDYAWDETQQRVNLATPNPEHVPHAAYLIA